MTRVVFIAFRFDGRDHVSAVSEKWIHVFAGWDFEVHRIAGFFSSPAKNDHLVPELNPEDPRVDSFTQAAFGGRKSKALTREFDDLEQDIAGRLIPLLQEISPDLIVAANIFSLPLNLPLTVALGRYLQNEAMPCIALHEDIYWRHEGFGRCAFDDVLRDYFPPELPQVTHVAADRHSCEEILQKKGIRAATVYNCFEFSEAGRKEAADATLRAGLGIGAGSLMLLLPMATVGAEGLARSVEFVEEFARATGGPAHLVITGDCPGGTPPAASARSGARVLHVPGWPGVCREQPASGREYSTGDAYACSDMIIVPCAADGSADPVLESVAFRKPLLVSDNPVLSELRELGFQFLPLDRQAVARAVKLFEHPQLMEEMLERNFEIGTKHFSLQTLPEKMLALVSQAKVPVD